MNKRNLRTDPKPDEEPTQYHEFDPMPGYPRTCWACGARKRAHHPKLLEEDE